MYWFTLSKPFMSKTSLFWLYEISFSSLHYHLFIIIISIIIITITLRITFLTAFFHRDVREGGVRRAREHVLDADCLQVLRGAIHPQLEHEADAVHTYVQKQWVSPVVSVTRNLPSLLVSKICFNVLGFQVNACALDVRARANTYTQTHTWWYTRTRILRHVDMHIHKVRRIFEDIIAYSIQLRPMILKSILCIHYSCDEAHVRGAAQPPHKADS